MIPKWKFASVLAALVLMTFPAVGQSGQTAEDVLVVNTTHQAVPTAAQGTTTVAGTVDVGNTPNVKVTNTPNVKVTNTPSVSISNTPNVSVTNTPSVNVANAPAVNLLAGATVGVISTVDGSGNPTPIAVLDAVQPYEDDCSIYFSAETGFCSFTEISPGKQLVIQEFDAMGYLEAGLKPAFISWSSSSTMQVSHYFPATFMGTANGDDYFATHQETRLYVPPTYSPQIYVWLTGASSRGWYTFQISGFLVDVPLGSDGAIAPGGQHQRQPMPPVRRPAPGR